MHGDTDLTAIPNTIAIIDGYQCLETNLTESISLSLPPLAKCRLAIADRNNLRSSQIGNRHLAIGMSL